MSETVLRTPSLRMRKIELSHEECTQLNAIIDLLIPSDNDFPSPSSLHLIDEFLQHIASGSTDQTAFMLNEKRLHAVLHELNTLADGHFCSANIERQQSILRYLEQQEPAFFQALWALTNHSYYTQLATTRVRQRRTSRPRIY